MQLPHWILVRNGLSPEWGYELLPGEHRVGRGKLCHIRLNHESVSREHALITVLPDRISMIDLGSRNGVFLDGRRVERATLSAGDSIRFGLVDVDLVRNVREARNRVLDTEETTMVGVSDLPPNIELVISNLTDSQRRVLALLLRGKSEKEMAPLLFISSNTVHNHIRRLYEKFGVQSRPELMALFIRTP